MRKLIDVGDIVGVRAVEMRRTDRGELSVIPASIDVLTKAVAPLPEKWHGLTDIEKRYRQRYLDMIVTPGVRDTLRSRSAIIATIRR